MRPMLLAGQTYHGRKGAVANAFRYSVDYVLIDPEGDAPLPRLFSRNRANVMALHDRDHGGLPGQGQGAAWLRAVLADAGLPAPASLRLLAQPRLWGHVFNPVSFWLCHDAKGALFAVVAEVTNTWGDRHSYLCHRDDLAPLGASDWVTAKKVFHVSPFQKVEGVYRFRFDIGAGRVGVWIDYARDGGGVYTNLTGDLRPLTARGVLWSALRRPFGSRRVLALIHWQALRLALRRVRYLARIAPPVDEVSR